MSGCKTVIKLITIITSTIKNIDNLLNPLQKRLSDLKSYSTRRGAPDAFANSFCVIIALENFTAVI